MVYLEDFDEFQSAAQELFAKNSGHRQVNENVRTHNVCCQTDTTLCCLSWPGLFRCAIRSSIATATARWSSRSLTTEW